MTNEFVGKFVPLRMICEWIGIPIFWDEETNKITVTNGTKILQIQLIYHEGNATITPSSTIRKEDILVRENTVYIHPKVLESTLGIQASYTKDGVVIDPNDYGSKASAFITQLQKGNLVAAHQLVNSRFLNATMSDQTLTLIQQLAFFQKIGKTVTKNPVHHIVTITYEAKNVSFDAEIRFDQDGKIDDLYFGMNFSGYQKPEYDHKTAYREYQVKIGTDETAVSGILTVPTGKGPFPTVILVQGDGELDQDSTVFAQKPFRDLAVGLAEKNVAVLRMNKVTREHYHQLNDHYTPYDEFVEPTFNALKVLHDMSSVVDPDQIFVAGHSRGGWMIPRILARDTKRHIAGAIVLAGADPRFSEIESYEQAGGGGMIPIDQMPYYRQQLKLVKESSFNPANPPKTFELGPNPYWWHQIRDYHPASEANLRKVDMLVLQGEDDFQVPMESLQGWKEIYSGRTNVTYRSYPKLTHLFTAGAIDHGIDNYKIPKNVDPTVIGDIADWVRNQGE